MTSRGQCPRGGCAWCSTHPSSDPPPPHLAGWLRAWYIYMSPSSCPCYPILPEGEWDFEIVGFCLPYYYPILPEGEWDLEIVGFCLPYYPIPQKGMGSCSSLVSCTLLLLSHPPEGDGILFFPGFMYTIIIILLLPCSKQWLRLWPSTQDI